MSETALWTWLKPYLPRGQYTRIENAEAGPGTPDVYYRIATASGWIELKEADHPNSPIPFPNDKKGLRKTQKRWISDNVALGGIVWIVARVGHEILWIHGTYALSFNGSTIQRLRSWATLIIDTTDPAANYRKIRRLLEGEHK